MERYKQIVERYKKDHGITKNHGTDYKKIALLGSDDTFLNMLKSKIHSVEEDPETALSLLSGLEDIKEQAISIRNHIAYYKNRGKKYSPPNGYNMCFYGPPGTGKTTIARILAGYLYKSGIISRPQIMEMDGNYLKTVVSRYGNGDGISKIIARADGGMLFIDEAYLLDGDKVGYDIIGTLLTVMEDLRDSLVIIFAGYTDEMKHFISLNPGLNSRIQYHINFRNYTPDELFAIFNSMASPDYSFNFDISLLKEQFEIETRRTDFANGRDMRKFLQKFIEIQADICAISDYQGNYSEFGASVLKTFLDWRQKILIDNYAVVNEPDGNWIIVPA